MKNTKSSRVKIAVFIENRPNPLVRPLSVSEFRSVVSIPVITPWEDKKPYSINVVTREFGLSFILEDGVSITATDGKVYRNTESAEYAIYTERRNNMYDNKSGPYETIFSVVQGTASFGIFQSRTDVENMIKRQIKLGVPKTNWVVVEISYKGVGVTGWSSNRHLIDVEDEPRIVWR